MPVTLGSMFFFCIPQQYFDKCDMQDFISRRLRLTQVKKAEWNFNLAQSIDYQLSGAANVIFPNDAG